MSEEGTLELKIDRVSKFIGCRNAVYVRSSVPIYIYGLAWKICALNSSFESLLFFLRCNEEDNDSNWSCQASIKLQIVSQKTGVNDYVHRVVKTFASNHTDYGITLSLSGDELLNPQKGFIKDDVVILRAHVKAEMPQGAQ